MNGILKKDLYLYGSFFRPKNECMNDKLSIIQPNIMTYAHYNFTALQKNIVYYIISAVQRHMTKIPPYSHPDLFGNLEIALDLRQLVQTSNYVEVHNAIKGLMKRTLSYSYKQENGKYMDVTTTILYTMKHERGSRKITLKVSAESIPVLLYIGEGFTAYNQTIAIALPSFYAKRLYEICCRWRDKGYMRMKLPEFRRMLGIDIYSEDGKKLEKQKFKQIKELKTEVLDKSMRLLKEQADYTFRYTLTKESSRSFNVIELWIEGKEVTQQKEYEMYQNVLMFIRNVYDDKKRAFEAVEFIYQNGHIKKAAERFKRLQKDVDTGKVKGHGLMAYLSTILIKEFGIPENMVVSEKTKRKNKAVEFVKEMAKEKGVTQQDLQKAAAFIMKGQEETGRRSRTTRRLGDLI